MKNILYILAFLFLFTSCNEYQKALKNEDIAVKYQISEKLYEEGKYAKANRLFTQIVPSYRGKPQAEKLMYMYCKSFYEMKDYYLAGYQFERFVNSYPKSEKVEEAAFLSAKSYYMLSPVYSKDQKDTKEAIEKLQEFINNYPDSEYLPEANKMVKELDYKLEKKAFEIAKQYNTISDYQASIQSFDMFLLDYPGSVLREDAMFYRLDAAFKLAINSVDYKKLFRLENAKSYVESFVEAYSESEKINEAKDMQAQINIELESIKTKS